MSSFKAHFDGTAIVLDEPATLAVGQEVRVVVDSQAASTTSPTPSGSWKGQLTIRDEGDDVVLDHFKDYLP